MTHRTPLVIAAILVCAAAAPAAADTPVRKATIELVETATGSSRTVAFTVALVDDGASSQIKSRMADGFYEIEVRRVTPRKGKGAPKLSVQLERHAPKGPTSLHMHATTTAAVGKRAVLLQVDRGDGTKYEVAATVR